MLPKLNVLFYTKIDVTYVKIIFKEGVISSLDYTLNSRYVRYRRPKYVIIFSRSRTFYMHFEAQGECFNEPSAV